ncbi:hypothetical protein BD410DRAFT_286426 [Rickenella mellea]|uniref:Uncharacterized protein n=1 Tax=Rickenella mellea TaxID=50990 RepID=A0A4Y7Q351_9AGAM|nr:hypothetical protein BD410DRAFT_286426 [Rickenella mellea]
MMAMRTISFSLRTMPLFEDLTLHIYAIFSMYWASSASHLLHFLRRTKADKIKRQWGLLPTTNLKLCCAMIIKRSTIVCSLSIRVTPSSVSGNTAYLAFSSDESATALQVPHTSRCAVPSKPDCGHGVYV